MIRWIWMSLLAGCAAQPIVYQPSEIKQEIMRFRHGHSGLTNQNCSAYDKDGGCSHWVVREYDLTNDQTRQTLVTLNFFCEVGSKRYRICGDKAELCRGHSESYKCGFAGLGTCHRTIVDRLPINADALADAGVLCASGDQFPLGIPHP